MVSPPELPGRTLVLSIPESGPRRLEIYHVSTDLGRGMVEVGYQLELVRLEDGVERRLLRRIPRDLDDLWRRLEER